MTIYVGVDDTDSKVGMCTTYIAIEVLKRLMKENLGIVSYPRLVRLNPNIPWKTRGNGAIALLIGTGSAREQIIGEINGKPIFIISDEEPCSNELVEDVFSTVCEVIEEFYISDDKNTNPGVVVTCIKPPSTFYWSTVRSVVKLESVMRWLESQKVLYKGWGNKRGLIGALAAISWSPKDKTYELLTYKNRNEWLKRPLYDKESVKMLDKVLRCSFDNYDYVEDCACIFPRALTPVLYGVRGDDPRELKLALKIVKTNLRPYAWLIFETNQGTDDHIVRVCIGKIRPRMSVLIEGIVSEKPKIIEGGHVIFKVQDDTGEIYCAAYEPTKGFRKIVLQLIPGDKVKIWGSVKEYPNTVNVEKIEVIELKRIIIKRPPLCPICKKRMTSAGKGKGFKCKRCGTRLPEDTAVIEEIPRKLKEGIYEVPPVARRHLSMPIKRIKMRERGLC